MGKNNESHDSSFLSGLVLGGILGAALALVLGKDESEELRRLLLKKGKMILNNLGELIKEEEDLSKHWGEEEKQPEPNSRVKKITQRFFHRNGKPLH